MAMEFIRILRHSRSRGRGEEREGEATSHEEYVVHAGTTYVSSVAHALMRNYHIVPGNKPQQSANKKTGSVEASRGLLDRSGESLANCSIYKSSTRRNRISRYL
jgi:hypothetical protein